MTTLISLALSPTFICLFYIFIRDKYEKEPLRLLLLGVLFGIVISFPIISTENLVSALAPQETGHIFDAFYSSFAVASFVEESFKFVILYFLVWFNNNFNERFDGIVYSVFISLGFAGFENILYVLNPELGGVQTALARAIFSVPGHALFGVLMGYYFALSKFENHNRHLFLFKAFIIPFLFHGLFDFILLSQSQYYMLIFIPFIIYMWVSGFKKMKVHIQKSPFKRHSAN